MIRSSERGNFMRSRKIWLKDIIPGVFLFLGTAKDSEEDRKRRQRIFVGSLQALSANGGIGTDRWSRVDLHFEWARTGRSVEVFEERLAELPQRVAISYLVVSTSGDRMWLRTRVLTARARSNWDLQYCNHLSANLPILEIQEEMTCLSIVLPWKNLIGLSKLMRQIWVYPRLFKSEISNYVEIRIRMTE
jgi:hypothetical protein